MKSATTWKRQAILIQFYTWGAPAEKWGALLAFWGAFDRVGSRLCKALARKEKFCNTVSWLSTDWRQFDKMTAEYLLSGSLTRARGLPELQVASIHSICNHFVKCHFSFYILKFSSKNIVVLPVHVVSIQLFQFNT